VVERVVLHIGTMKSGTTYLQRVLDTGVVESVGGFFAGGSFRTQAKAVDSLFRKQLRQAPKPWTSLAERTLRRDGVAVYSHEFLSFVSQERVGWVVDAFEGTPVDVVLTVRDQRTAIPAQWQSYVRNRGTDPWETYLQRLERVHAGKTRRKDRRARAVRGFRRSQGVPGMVARWAGHPGVSSVSVVLVPPPGSPPQLLWQRFCDAAGLAASDAPETVSRQNESLGYASCELLRRLNPMLADLSLIQYERGRRAPIQALLPLRAEEQRPVLDESGDVLASDLNRAVLDAVAEHGARLVGEADELPVTGQTGLPASVPVPAPDELLRAAETVWASCMPGIARPAGDLDALVAELGRRLAVRFGP
jgi:hypothetical protein